MYEKILNIDFALLEFLDIIRCGALDGIMLFLSRLADKGFLWIVLGIVLLFFKKTRRAGVCVLLALLINFLIVNVSIKPLISRQRPFDVRNGIELLLAPPSDFSFPSGHTSASFASAVALLFYFKKWGIASVVLAAFIAFSRLYLYVHFPTDVICGAVFGIVSAFAAYRIQNKIKILPQK